VKQVLTRSLARLRIVYSFAFWSCAPSRMRTPAVAGPINSISVSPSEVSVALRRQRAARMPDRTPAGS
jgi:hypothetical protein